MGKSSQKERHIVSWSQEEDDILREQIQVHGTENWSIIASKFKDKTTRQCRRRWYTYLNSDFKKGGWSPEEDVLLCEAQKIFGNRWTEIAKVVSGRTDNAVKNRFSTLCKKRAKHDALAKGNNISYRNNIRGLFGNESSAAEISETATLLKKIRRTHFSDLTENCNHGKRLSTECGTKTDHQPRPPFAVLVQNLHNLEDLSSRHHGHDTKEISNEVNSHNIQGTFLKKDDPKIFALLQQAELLSSLAVKVNTEGTGQSLENAWEVLQDFLHQTNGSDVLNNRIYDMDFQLEVCKDLVEDLRSSNEGSQPSWRQPDLCEESPCSSEHSTGSTLLYDLARDKMEQSQCDISTLYQDSIAELQATHMGDENCDGENGNFYGETTNQEHVGVISSFSSTEFSSPLQVTPIFRSFAAEIPSPKFSESGSK
ncbi:transcription factor MYB124-like isoform X2 [Diospyros lotus]|uniref:transcription factor MYB124-like isoform X2 n=1 Tax=Diospyros lotus TaxID=55363 RepID=UPI00225A89E1|nr:transcription factor MYB124-like isoform X2 [Diospyros lotus]